jgi:sulfite reductase (NADPH) flavoprotein alpha-component
LFDLIEVDNANINDIQRWNQALSVITKHELHAMNIEKVFDQWMLSERYVLNPNSVGDPAFNIELTAPHDMTWHAGDIAEIQPANSLIQEFLVKYQIQHMQ